MTIPVKSSAYVDKVAHKSPITYNLAFESPGVNLGSACIMRFIKGEQVIDIEMPGRSVYVMQDDARKKWKHTIPPRKKDNVGGNIKHRERRVSITYRKVKQKQVHPINSDGKVAKILQDVFHIGLDEIRQV